MRSRHLAPLVAALTIFGVACGDDSSDSDGSAADTESADLALASTDLGEILVDANGATVYQFTADAQGDSTCYDACEANWPIVDDIESVGEGLDDSLLSTTTRDNGDVQATYNGWPLYYFAGDDTAGNTNGQGINDVWWVTDADGDAIKP